jgi:hypothetical protein
MISDDPSVSPIVEKLSASPLFNLSLSSKELFHSNFLAWLCEEYPGQIGRWFTRFINNDARDKSEQKEVLRESRHVDLTIMYENGEQLLIENKVKSLPSKEQLEEISSGVKKKDRARTSFLLLTLVCPTFLSADEKTNKLIRLQVDNNEVTWRWITYRDLGDALKTFVPDIDKADHYHGELLKDYVGFIGNLDELQSYFSIDWADDAGDFFVADPVMKQIRDIRLHDLVDKLRYEQLAWQVRDELHRENFCVKYDDISSPEKVKSLHAIAPEVQVFCDSAMTRSTGISDFKYILPVDRDTPVTLGVQLQANTLKLFLEMDDEAKARKAAGALWQPSMGNRIWYDFGGVKGGLDQFPKDQDKTFNHYGRTFFYRSIRMGPTSPKSLVEIIIAYFRLIRDNEATLLQQLENVL